MRSALGGHKILASAQPKHHWGPRPIVPQQADPDRDRGSRKVNISSVLQPYKNSTKKPLCCNTPKRRRSGVKLQTPAPASTLVVLRPLASPVRAHCKQRAGFKKSLHQFSSEGAGSWPTTILLLSVIYKPSAGSSEERLPRPLCRCDTITLRMRRALLFITLVAAAGTLLAADEDFRVFSDSPRLLL